MNMFLWCVLALHGVAALANLWALTEDRVGAGYAQAINVVISSGFAVWAFNLL
jgi:hypothetical protein